MAHTKEAWNAESWEELKSLTGLETVKKALFAREKNRLYHKAHNLRVQSILAKAKEMGIEPDEEV